MEFDLRFVGFRKSYVRHEETVLVSSMLLQVRDCVKTLILFCQIKSVFQVYQCMADLFPSDVKEAEYFCRHFFSSSIDFDLEIAFR